MGTTEVRSERAFMGEQFTYKTKPYAHQVEAFEKFKGSEYFGLFMDMGTGKSKVAIDVAAYKFLRQEINAVLVLAPNNVHAQWVREQFPEHCSVAYRPFIWDSGQKGRKIWDRWLDEFMAAKEPRKLKVLAVNIEAFQSNTVVPTVAEFVKNHKCMIVVDESTRIKTPTAKRSKVVHKLNKYGVRCILTGTPTAKSPFDLWSQFEFLKHDYFNCKYFIFQHRYGVMVKGTNQYTGARYHTLIDEKAWNIVKSKIKQVKKQRGGKLHPSDYEYVAVSTGVSERNVRFIETQDKFVKYKKLDELRDYISPDVFSIRKEDCLDLPEKVYEVLPVSPTTEQKRIYEQLKKQLLAEYEGKQLTVMNKVALTTRLLQVCGGFFPYVDDDDVSRAKLIGKKNAKVEALLADLEEAGEQQVIVWAHFQKELELLKRELSKNYTVGLYYGRTSTFERKKIVDDFRSGQLQVFLGNPATAGFGLNLQNSTLAYFFSNSFRTEDRLQAEDRQHRIGVKGSCVYKDVVMVGTIDEAVHRNITAGRDLNDYFKQHSLREILEGGE